jgi:hypothetical protein
METSEPIKTKQPRQPRQPRKDTFIVGHKRYEMPPTPPHVSFTYFDMDKMPEIITFPDFSSLPELVDSCPVYSNFKCECPTPSY